MLCSWDSTITRWTRKEECSFRPDSGKRSETGLWRPWQPLLRHLFRRLIHIFQGIALPPLLAPELYFVQHPDKNYVPFQRGALPPGRLIGIDQDADAIAEASERLKPYGRKITIVRNNYRNIGEIMKECSRFSSIRIA